MKRRLFIDALSFASPGVAALVCALTAACAAQRGAPLQPRDSLLTGVNNEAAPQETWLYRPLHPAALLARIAVDAERTLYVGRSGERWLSDSSQRSDTPASALAPEGLIAAAAQGDKGWAFIGESGSVYLSDAPLGPWTSVRQSTEALVQVTAAADSLVAVGRQGQLWQSPDLGLSWGKVGPAGVRFADVAMTSAGSAIALSVPEQSWLSGDYGKSWQLQPIAARGLLGVAARDGTILARGVLGRYAWRAAAQGGDFQSATNEQFAPLSLPFKKPRGPSARALQSRHALVVLGRYFELSREAVDGDKRSGWKLYSGLVAGELGETPVPSLAQCSDVALTASEDILYLACARESGRGKGNSLVNIDLLAGGASGEQWKSLGVTISGKLGQLQWVAGANGALAFSGACPASKPDCASAGIYFVERAGQSHKPTLRVSGAPSLEGSAAALIASADGRRIYALGRRTKSDVLGLFVSQNGGRTFDAREVDGLPVRAISASSLGTEQAGVAADGTITVSFAALTGTRARLAVFDEQGRLMALS
ncbi:MAG TPA: hypothetical protein VL137_16620, partial [Polyangiaceae bacterium]|nr:hypothetical protein [Polyangiaceae bacterium]